MAIRTFPIGRVIVKGKNKKRSKVVYSKDK